MTEVRQAAAIAAWFGFLLAFIATLSGWFFVAFLFATLWVAYEVWAWDNG